MFIQNAVHTLTALAGIAMILLASQQLKQYLYSLI